MRCTNGSSKAFCALTAPILGVLRQKDKNKNTIRAAEIKLFFFILPPHNIFLSHSTNIKEVLLFFLTMLLTLLSDLAVNQKPSYVDVFSIHSYIPRHLNTLVQFAKISGVYFLINRIRPENIYKYKLNNSFCIKSPYNPCSSKQIN